MSNVPTLEIARELAIETPSKIVLLVMDGLGGLPDPSTGLTEMETASLPNLDRLARRAEVGLTEPMLPGVTVGSGPGHLALFGYDPLSFRLGRGASSALGIGFPLMRGDVAARINFATVDDRGLIVNRRAGRITTEDGRRLSAILGEIPLPGVQTFVYLEVGHRAVVVFRGEGLSHQLSDSDPQREGKAVLPVRPLAPEAQRSASVVNQFIERAMERLRGEKPANAVLLRGFAGLPQFPSMHEVYRVRAAAISAFPTYQGIARSVGMEVLSTGNTLESEVATLESCYSEYDFIYLHSKWTDSAGEDGRFDEKVQALEDVDRIVPRIAALNPDVLAVAGDHSSPSVFREHTWHPVPFLVRSPWSMPGPAGSFTERECARGSLGRFPALRAMLLMMAHAGKLRKFGA